MNNELSFHLVFNIYKYLFKIRHENKMKPVLKDIISNVEFAEQKNYCPTNDSYYYLSHVKDNWYRNKRDMPRDIYVKYKPRDPNYESVILTDSMCFEEFYTNWYVRCTNYEMFPIYTSKSRIINSFNYEIYIRHVKNEKTRKCDWHYKMYG